MRRSDTREGIYRLIEKLRMAVPDVVLRTTLMVGFPGKSDEQFAELLDFIRWAKLDALGCFKYYPESGTAAAKMPGQAPDIDGVCIVKNCSAQVGQFIDTKVVGTKDYDLVVEQI